MVYLIEELHSIKKYREQTFYFAVSIADRYLAKLAAQGVAWNDGGGATYRPNSLTKHTHPQDVYAWVDKLQLHYTNTIST